MNDEQLIFTINERKQQNYEARSFSLSQKPQIRVNSTLFFANFCLCISEVSFSQLNVSLLASLAFPNAEPIRIPLPYSSLFLKKLNQTPKNVRYISTQNAHVFKLQFASNKQSISEEIVKECLNVLKEEKINVERALEEIGILRPRNKKRLLAFKKQQLFLKKQVVAEIKAPKIQIQNVTQQLSSCLVKVQKIQQIQGKQKTNEKSKKGGYFQVKKVECRITDGNRTKLQSLACKVVRNKSKVEIYPKQKLIKQIRFASILANPTHFAKYYIEEDYKPEQKEIQKFYMEFIPDSLKDEICNKDLSIVDMLDLGSQLIQGVQHLHASSIVHRDLKPENILIKKSCEGRILKIIDFGESALTSAEFDSKTPMGCTLPYSPMECMSGTEGGFNQPEIDLWSVSLILYEMAFKCVPMFYSRCIGPQIVEQWMQKNDFSIFPIYRKRGGCRAIEQIVSLISIWGLRIKQKERISLDSLKKVFVAMKLFLQPQ